MKRTLILISLLLLAKYSFSQESFETGVVVDSVICEHDAQQSYALYLPSYYEENKSWPIFYIFEPGARGKLPVNIFKKAAEEYGYIIVASNNSRNGNWQRVFDAADAMLLDTQKRFSLDTARFYTSGFSGGARAAIAISTLTGNIRGIIGCGAGNANRIDLSIRKRDNLVYVGIVGDRDMNYLEHKLFEEHLNELEIPNIRLISHDKHQWPSEDMILLAFNWLELKTNSQLTSERKELITKSFEGYFQSIISDGDIIESLRFQEYLKRDLNIELNDSIVSLGKSKDVKKLLARKSKIEKKEIDTRSYHNKAFKEIPETRLVATDSTKGVLWWESQIKRWQKKSQSDDILESNSSLRILNQIWARCAQNTFQEESRGDFELAMKYNEIWLIVEPENTWGLWTKARLLTAQGQYDMAMEQLLIAAKTGKISLKAIKREKLFTPLLSHQKFEELKPLLWTPNES